MADLLLPFIVLSLIAVIIIQAFERYFNAKQLLGEQQRLVTALLSKSAGEYAAAVKTVVTPQPNVIPESPITDTTGATEDEFDRMIARQNGEDEEDE